MTSPTSRAASTKEIRRSRTIPAVPTGYTLVEMMVTVAALIIVLGLMVSLARYVRERAAMALTKQLLRQLDDLADQYAKRNNGALPPVTPFPPPQLPVPPRPSGNPPASEPPGDDLTVPGESTPAERQALANAALENSRRLVVALKADPELSDPLTHLPRSIYDEQVLRDAWGSPIVFMPSKHPLVGTAPNDRFFFFSAGPDRLYLTQDDNLYSYEDLSIEAISPIRR